MRKKILLVDDKGEFRTILQIILQTSYDVISASDGLEALGILKSGYFPDLIISDLTMPNVDGASLVQQIKASDIYKHIPVLILSSITDNNKIAELFRYGASDYMNKPFYPEELRMRINRLLNIAG